MGHWYDWGGGKRHTIIGKNGKERDTHVGDARKNNWVPSFSEVWAVKAAHQLVNWKLKQMLLAGAAVPRHRAEELGDQGWMDKVLALYEERTTKARDRGTEIHREIEKALTDTVWIPSPEAHAAIVALDNWCGHGGNIYVEKSFAHKLGYGGQCDVHKAGFVADFKSTEFTEDDLPKTWDNHAAQLAAYREGLGMPDARCAIIYVSTSVPGLTHTVEIPEAELSHGWNLFVRCLSLWQMEKKYWPVYEEELV